jgi:hypothetical protein
VVLARVDPGAFEQAVVAALSGTDDDRAAAALEVQYDAWGHAALPRTPAGAAAVADAVARIRARESRSPRLDRALARYEPPHLVTR